MELKKIDYDKVEAISKKDLDYIKERNYLKPFYQYPSNLESFEKAIADRRNYPINRTLLVETLRSQYTEIETSALTTSNIDSLLREDTFTVITAHQPALLGGPLYYIFKIACCINLSRKLNEAYPSINVVPVFINGSEDHDFEEIDHFNIFGNAIKWERDASGPVGRMDTDGLQKVVDQVADILGDSPTAEELIANMHAALDKANTYNDFVIHFVNALFGKYGLIIANTDDQQLKAEFAPIMKREITERLSERIVQDTQEKLEQEGFKAQAHPRDINFFYIDERGRNRITFESGKYQVVDTSLSWSESEILNLVDEHPERFSPNVVMRPIYQEFTFPNLAYIGGGGENAYWLERKSQFEAFGVFYPLIIRRNSAIIMDKRHIKKLNQVNLSEIDIFEPEYKLVQNYIDHATNVDIHLRQEKGKLAAIWKEIAEKAAQVDPTLKKSVLAEMSNQLKSIDSIESRMSRKIKADEEVNVNRIKKIKSLLFPQNGLQERHDNFMSYYLTSEGKLLDFLVDNLNPLDKSFYVIKI